MVEDINQNQLEGIKLQFNALLAEYKMVRDEVAQFRNMQGQLDNLALTALGLSAPLTLAIYTNSPDAFGIVLLIPFLFLAISFIQIRHERGITIHSIYVHSYLRPKVSQLLTQLSVTGPSIFGFEYYLTARHITRHLYVQWVITLSRAGVSLAISVGLSIAFIYLQVSILEVKWSHYETILVFAGVLLLCGNLWLGFSVAELTYRFRSTPSKSQQGAKATTK